MADPDTYWFCHSCKAVIDSDTCPYCPDGGDVVGPIDEDQLP